ncbi:Phage terminase small subunit [Hyphomicrobiales bacterium]|nr:Phage terminase small subunit [Hyphomicrobiales bacterium]CAH1664052.1 Phage terminase small subunit [Hyphomicrobiales bacterium]
MPALKNAKWERFAQELAKGKSLIEAHGIAGFRPNRGNAAVLKQKQCISDRVDELLRQHESKDREALERATERLSITKERVLAELAKIGFANMLDYMRVGPDGDPVLDFSALSSDHAAALVEVTVEDFKDGRGEDARDVRRVKFKLADKRAALVDLGKHLGLFRERVSLENPDGSSLGPPVIQFVRDADPA